MEQNKYLQRHRYLFENQNWNLKLSYCFIVIKIFKPIPQSIELKLRCFKEKFFITGMNSRNSEIEFSFNGKILYKKQNQSNIFDNSKV